jgi:hypothetical protein
MRRPTLLFCTAALAFAANCKSPDLLATNESDDLIKYTGSPKASQAKPLRVIAIGISEVQEAKSAHEDDCKASGIKIPPNALWPDRNGNILVYAQDPEATLSKGNHRNPWVRSSPVSTVENDSTFLCGGIIIGEAEGGIAILNGRIAKSGDEFGQFSIAGVSTVGVILRRKGTFLILPRGQRVTVSLKNI